MAKPVKNLTAAPGKPEGPQRYEMLEAFRSQQPSKDFKVSEEVDR